MTTDEIVEQIKTHHKWRRYWMKVQQKLDRAMESFVRINYTEWPQYAEEGEESKARKQEAAKALTLIKAAKDGEGPDDLLTLVDITLKAREPADKERNMRENTMAKLAKQLPVYPWIKDIRGAAELGLGTVLAEAGNGLDKFPTPSHLWSRLGYAPYRGFAGSSWKRESWHPGEKALTAEEWTEHPFKGARYALIYQVGLWLVNAQVEGKEKTGTKYGKPNGRYGEIYVRRRERTELTHPNWTPLHARQDAIRVATKAYLKDLWIEWNEHAVPGFVSRPWQQAAE